MLAQSLADTVRSHVQIHRDTLPDPDLWDTLEPDRSAPRAIVDRRPIVRVETSRARLGHFELGALLGRGGMGAVYAGWDRSLERAVAIKVLPDDVARDPEVRARFLREARAQARLSSPHVAHIHFVGQNPAFFAMELVEGGTLESWLARAERLEPEHARRLMIEAARGLRAAFEAGLVHRDVKPSNLLLDRSGHVKITDFGVAKRIDPSAERGLESSGQLSIVGTPLYMAPEQAQGLPVDHRADMYSLGCSFYHLLAGEPPFHSAKAIDVVRRHVCEPPRPLRELAPAVPESLASIIERLLEKDPSRRYASYNDLIDALHAAAPYVVRHAGFWARGAAAAVDIVIAAITIRLLGWPGLILHLAYVTLAHAIWGRTLGKWTMSLELRRSEGGRLGLVRSLLRTLTSFWMPLLAGVAILFTSTRSDLSSTLAEVQLGNLNALSRLLLALFVGNALFSALYGIGLALAALHPQKRAIHDLLTGSEVVYRLT